jgi:hypothetical protein
MTKAELIERISALPDNIVFLLSSDEEGNSYRTADLDDNVQKAIQDGYEWELIHEDDVDEYDEDLTDVVVFW